MIFNIIVGSEDRCCFTYRANILRFISICSHELYELQIISPILSYSRGFCLYLGVNGWTIFHDIASQYVLFSELFRSSPGYSWLLLSSLNSRQWTQLFVIIHLPIFSSRYYFFIPISSIHYLSNFYSLCKIIIYNYALNEIIKWWR